MDDKGQTSLKDNNVLIMFALTSYEIMAFVQFLQLENIFQGDWKQYRLKSIEVLKSFRMYVFHGSYPKMENKLLFHRKTCTSQKYKI